MKENFSKEQTLNIKGISVILLCMHHLFWTSNKIPMVFPIENNYAFLTVVTKVCVALFTILSGYGINESYKKKKTNMINFIDNYVKKLLVNYWYIFIPIFFLSFIFHVAPLGAIQVYGTGIIGILFFLLDFLGVRAFLYTPTLNNTWWYMEAILCCYLLFPIIRKGINKKTILTFIILIIPNILSIWNEQMLITTDREIYYLLPFAIFFIFSRTEYGICILSCPIPISI
jgi:hypothetical protein